MARHYYRTNVPLPIMIVWWIFIGIVAVIGMAYSAIVNGPKERAQEQWDRDHFNGWRLQAETYDTEHGLMMDRLNKVECSTKGYPGYPACPTQQYFVDGKPNVAP